VVNWAIISDLEVHFWLKDLQDCFRFHLCMFMEFQGTENCVQLNWINRWILIRLFWYFPNFPSVQFPTVGVATNNRAVRGSKEQVTWLGHTSGHSHRGNSPIVASLNINGMGWSDALDWIEVWNSFTLTHGRSWFLRQFFYSPLLFFYFIWRLGSFYR